MKRRLGRAYENLRKLLEPAATPQISAPYARQLTAGQNSFFSTSTMSRSWTETSLLLSRPASH